MASILITGANRGIGLGLVKRILTEEGPFHIVIATYRNPSKSKELISLTDKYSNLHILKLDVSEFDTFKNFAKEVENIVGKKGLNILFNNAGVILKNKAGNLKTLTPQEYLDVFNVNAFAPLFLVQALLPVLVLGAKKINVRSGIPHGAILNVSSLLGSISDNSSGSYWAYRESKSALNQVTRNLAKETDILNNEIIVVALHPGHVRTDMGGQFGKLSVEESTNGLYDILTSLDYSMHDKFIQWDQQELPW